MNRLRRMYELRGQGKTISSDTDGVDKETEMPWSSSSEAVPFLEEQNESVIKKEGKRKQRFSPALQFSIVAILWAFSLIITIHVMTERVLKYSYENGFSTELGWRKEQSTSTELHG